MIGKSKFHLVTIVKSWLQVFQSRKIAALLFIGFSSGLPLFLTSKTLQAWMKTENVDLGTIGWFSAWVGFPYAFKFLWSPLLDRFVPPFLGRRRGWLLVTQILLIISIGAMAMQQPAKALQLLAINAVMIAFFSASQDIAADAYRTDVLAPAERGAGVSVFVLGYRVGMILAAGWAFKLADQFKSWQPVYLVMAGLMLLGLIASLLAPGTEDTDRPPATLQDAIVLPFMEFFQRRGIAYGGLVLLFVVLYKLSDAMMQSMGTSFLLEKGFSQNQIGDIQGVMGIIATIVGALVGGILLSKMSVFKGLWIFGGLQAAGIILYYALAMTSKSDQLFVLAINIENFFAGMEKAAFVAFLMAMCNKQFSATQYALLSSLMALSNILVGPAGNIAKSVGWPNFFLLSMVAIIPSLLLLIWIAKQPPDDQLSPVN
jgi:MFS transporter, PAT family, beta-lactamase induction signal transducer AmpG